MTADPTLLTIQTASERRQSMEQPLDAAGKPAPLRRVLRRKTRSDATSVVADAAAHKHPATQASLIATAWRGGVHAVIDAGTLMTESLRAFRDDPQHLDAFVAGLVAVDLLTSREARLGLRSPKLVKLNAIGENADLLRRAEITPYLAPSYSTIYQLTVLFGQMEGEHEDKVRRLVGIVKNCPGEVTRDYLGDETDRLKQSRKSKQTKPGPGRSEQAHQSGPESAVSGKVADTPSGHVDSHREFDLAVLTPTEQDFRTLGRDYADGTTLEQSLPRVRVLQHNDDLALVVSGREADFPVIVERLLPLCGFRRVSKVLLARKPGTWDITDAEILVVAERGGMRFAWPQDSGWADGSGEIDVLAIANRLYPRAQRKLHVFAPALAEGWTSFVGADSWTEEPSVR